ncbi:hypothetical protein ANCCAN_01867 [Ancylostoma caninum]|uniref:SCP domain-containing protein n=1 Tax=Ancylostoma caninum TaxID=29170 RepID=A0A368H8Y0_ANCCA|nr:hypothetical protein ANCCAN_01867 [Ancylostoma caninum]
MHEMGSSTHPAKISMNALVILLSVITVSESVYIQKTHSCRQLGDYAFRSKLRDRMATGIMFYQGKIAWSTTRVYLCALEGMAGLILENPYKPVNCIIDLGIFPLIFESDGTHSDSLYVSKEALQAMKPHMPSLSVATGFGCNSVVEDRKHKYLCLFKLDMEISR